ncbi:MAG: M20/M25/M40 family metallo-hydrolase [Halobacteriales archaeon]
MAPPAADFDPVDFLERAVATPSHDEVDAMRELLLDELGQHGVDATVDGAGNVVAERGAGAPHVALNTHLDTVGPHVPVESDGDVVRGRGACDAKGPLAAMLDAFLAGDGPRRTLAVTPDEETRSTGAAALDLDVDAVVVGEPTGLDVCNAARGRFEAVVSLSGVNAHAAAADEGVNAVAAARYALAAIDTFDDERGPPAHDALGPPLLTPTVVRGGEAANQVPDACAITVDRRSVPPETAAGFRDALAAHVRAAVPEPVGVEVRLADRPTPFLEAFETPADAPIVAALADASGGAVRPFGAATEASYFAATAPTVVFGPGGLADDAGPVAHADREYVRVEAVRGGAAALREALATLA